MTDKLEAVKKVSETLSKQSMNPAEEMERMAPNKEQFQSLIDSSQPLKPASFEKIDPRTMAPEEVQTVDENKPVFADENVTSQKSGSATDQESKKKRQQTEEIDEVGATQSKKKADVSKSLMDEVGKLNASTSKMSQLNPDAIKTQAKGLISQLDQVKTQLSQSQGEIKPSYQTLLRNRLSHIDDNLKIALSKVGIENPPSAPTTGTATGNANPLQRFITMVSNSQHQLEHLSGTVDQLNANGGQITPANMLAIQIKMSYVQQQIELFTSLLNKALESTKTIMNVQV